MIFAVNSIFSIFYVCHDKQWEREICQVSNFKESVQRERRLHTLVMVSLRLSQQLIFRILLWVYWKIVSAFEQFTIEWQIKLEKQMHTWATAVHRPVCLTISQEGTDPQHLKIKEREFWCCGHRIIRRLHGHERKWYYWEVHGGARNHSELITKRE